MNAQIMADPICPYIKTWDQLSKFIKEGRECKLTGELCFKWSKSEQIQNCEVREKHEAEELLKRSNAINEY